MTDDDKNAPRISREIERTREAWVPSATGLGAYISALRARMLLVVLGYCFALFAVALKSPKLGDVLLVATPGLSLVFVVAMAAGVLRYGRLPQGTAGKGMARLSFFLLVVSALFSAYALLLALPAVGVTVVPASLDAQAGGAFSAVWRLSFADLASQVAILGSLFALLMSFVSVAGSLGADDVKRRASRALTAISLATTMAVAFGCIKVFGAVRHEAVVLGGLGALAVALVAVAMAFGVARCLQAYVTNLGPHRASEAPLGVLAWRNA